MAKRKFTLTSEEQKELLRAYRTCKDANTRIRYQAVRLYGKGYSEVEVEQITGCSRTSMMEWCRAYRADPSQGLVDKRLGGNRAKLGKLQIEELQQVLYQYTPKERLGSRATTSTGQFWTVEDLVLVVRERYGVEYQMRSDLMSAEVSAQHLELILETNPGVPILLFWDRSHWHRGKPIDKVLQEHPRLEIVFFPTVSPDLNPQE